MWSFIIKETLVKQYQCHVLPTLMVMSPLKTPEVPTHRVMKDSLGRPHFKIPHTGPTNVCLRAAHFHGSTCEMHTHDLIPLIRNVVSEGKMVVTLIVMVVLTGVHPHC